MKKNDRVVCIDASKDRRYVSPNLTEGREYIIYAVHKCSCGLMSFDVGITRDSSKPMCCLCFNTHDLGSTIHWCNSKRFAKVKEQYKIIHMGIEIEEPILN